MIVILKNFNGKIGNDVVPGVAQRFNELTKNNNGERLLMICANNEPKINNTFFDHKQ